jgi:N-acetyl-anhydromuramyl-L-alanine amidase AmpD
MKVDTSLKSPNFSDKLIPVTSVVLHFTAVSLPRTLEIFNNPDSQASSHLLIGKDGTVYELVPCLGTPDGKPNALRAWHAGVSRYERDGVLLEGFNDFSIGIEIENLNGNVFKYTDAQYDSLQSVFASLKKVYPEIQKPGSVFGHEEVAGHRGKVDPGHHFDWKRFYRDCYPDTEPIPKSAELPKALLQSLESLVAFAPDSPEAQDDFFAALSLFCESAVAEINK